jgi:prophage tail gpP-like protein
MAEAIKLLIDGEVFEGWDSVGLQKDLDSLCATFDLSLTETLDTRVDREAITDGAACEIMVGSEVFVTGFIDTIRRIVKGSSREIIVSGRDKTCDLVDCSAIHKTGSWRNQTLEQIVKDLIKPYGLKLSLEANTGARFTSFAIEQGEEVFAAITRLCRLRGLMATTDFDATLIIFSPSKDPADIRFELGVNIEEFDFMTTHDNRFSDYIVKGQHQGGDFNSPKDSASPKGTATDPGVKRYRPIILLSDEQATTKGLINRAKWEATTRLAKAQSLTIQAMGWRDEKGRLYRPNRRAYVAAATEGVDRELMIASVRFDLEGATTTSLGLVRPEAFTTEVIPEPKAKKTKAGKTKKANDSSWSITAGYDQ